MQVSLISTDKLSSKDSVKKVLNNLDLHVEKYIEKSVNERFWLRLVNAIVVTVYFSCVGVAFIPKRNYLDQIFILFIMLATNGIIIYSVCKIKSTIKKLELVFPQDRYIDIHVVTFVIDSILYIVI